jgi:hypothetical protein
MLLYREIEKYLELHASKFFWGGTNMAEAPESLF